jgi:predicted DCC family thiol-disulfide oxidoreductase YuxK
VSDLNQLGGRLLIIFDGQCGLCNRSVRWLLRHDQFDRMRFVPSDSPLVQPLLARHSLDAATTVGNSGTMLVAQAVDTPAEQLFLRSNAILALLRQLPLPWPALGATLRLIPRPLRDLGYRLIARFRYRIWGRLDACPIPTAEERSRFLESTDAPRESC